jgi:hypothetical protein
MASNRQEQWTAERVADRAMGVELMVIDVEQELEWAEAQGRLDDVVGLLARHRALLDDLADIVDHIPVAA